MTIEQSTTQPLYPTTPGYRLEYIVTHEAWYSDAIDRDPAISVVKAKGTGGCDWEFSIVDRSSTFRQPTIQVRVFDETFPAFAELAPFFAALAAEKPNTLDQVRAILDRLGFMDATQRTDPERA